MENTCFWERGAVVRTRLPMGIENFQEMRTEGFYYVDKTGLIRDFLENFGKVNLFTRPRRFGKTLTMSMLKYFFEAGSDRALFDGLAISEEKELFETYMGKCPVISVTLKGATGRSFDEAKGMLRDLIGTEALRFEFLTQSDRLSGTEQEQYRVLTDKNKKGIFTMEDAILKNSLKVLSQLLYRHYGQKTVILIDEYDVPLDKAYQSGYYDEMAELMRVLFGSAFKTNDNLFCAVLTGCLRVTKESIFTGLNNFNVFTIKDAMYNEYFGFTDTEVRELLGFYGWMDRYDVIKEWYDGYRFGGLEIYCPWDVISYCHSVKMKPSVKPKNYWVNTSSNDIIRKFVGMANAATRDEIELLIAGKCIQKRIHQELTYRDLDTGIDNLWSLLYTTGYLTQCETDDDERTALVIPNREIRWIFVEQIRKWFQEETGKDTAKLERLCKAFEMEDVAAIEAGFTQYLANTISIRDTYVKKDMKENFYHGVLLGLFAHMDGWVVRSNAEAGEGYSDIAVKIESKEIGIIIEIKYAENAAFEAACGEAVRQIREKNYEEVFVRDGMRTIYRYGIACYQKRCRVVSC
ncbi:MAG: ATP-binding protein [Lachnospiraceae bacterium]|nr:ATP-binding protein [Lachnospiraceae bacterium]